MKRELVVFAVVMSGCVAPMGTDGGTMMSTDGGRTGGGRDGGSTGGGGGGGGGGGSTGMPSAPEWQMADARVAGRTGRDLRVSIKATDRNLDVVSAFVRLLDAQGATLAEGTVSIDGKKWVGESVTGAAWWRGVFIDGMNGPSQAAVTLVDATGLSSEEQVLNITAQPVIARGGSCDATFLENRCEAGLGCRGMPAVCDEGLAPQLTRLAFFRGANGPTILMEGTEPEDDLATLRFTFQNQAGQAISIDSDGDGSPDLASFDQPANGVALDGAFFMNMQSGVGLDTQVPRLVVTPIDAAGHTGMIKIASPTTQPIKTAGQTCDPRGFDTCAAGLACSPGIVGATTNKCTSSAPMRTQQCSMSTVLIPTPGGSVVNGVAEGGSLWDAPSGCATNDPTGRPEGVVVLRMTERADRVRLSTVGSGTNFDTVLYVVPGCPNDTADVMGCSDDVMGGAGASEVVLENVPAGDYLVVIDSFDGNGGNFELRATIE
ncbi:MAG: hypothetical protein QM817_19260 [Archangium sp.]